MDRNSLSSMTRKPLKRSTASTADPLSKTAGSSISRGNGSNSNNKNNNNNTSKSSKKKLQIQGQLQKYSKKLQLGIFAAVLISLLWTPVSEMLLVTGRLSSTMSQGAAALTAAATGNEMYWNNGDDGYTNSKSNSKKDQKPTHVTFGGKQYPYPLTAHAIMEMDPQPTPQVVLDALKNWKPKPFPPERKKRKRKKKTTTKKNKESNTKVETTTTETKERKPSGNEIKKAVEPTKQDNENSSKAVPNQQQSMNTTSTTTITTTNMTNTNTNDPNVPNAQQLLLRVPFYVYEEFFLDHYEPFVDNQTKSWQEWRTSHRIHKHADDYFFYQAALRHPLRTMDPEKAQLFVVPLEVNTICDHAAWSTSKHQTKLCLRTNVTNKVTMNSVTAATDSDNQLSSDNHTDIPTTICDVDVLRWFDLKLKRSPFFQRNQGSDHILVGSHWASKWKLSEITQTTSIKSKKQTPTAFKGDNINQSALLQCNIVGFEQQRINNDDRLFIPKFYVGNECPLLPDGTEHPKLFDFAMVASMKSWFTVRQNMCRWMVQSRVHMKRRAERGLPPLPPFNYSIGHCGSRNSGTAESKTATGGNVGQCPVLAQAKYGPHVPGDTAGSNRLWDLWLSNTVPVFTFPIQYEILPPFLDWRALSLYADGSNPFKYINDVHGFANQDTTQYQLIQQRIRQHQGLLDWTKTESWSLLQSKKEGLAREALTSGTSTTTTGVDDDTKEGNVWLVDLFLYTFARNIPTIKERQERFDSHPSGLFPGMTFEAMDHLPTVSKASTDEKQNFNDLMKNKSSS